jgi:hypothetical protein
VGTLTFRNIAAARATAAFFLFGALIVLPGIFQSKEPLVYAFCLVVCLLAARRGYRSSSVQVTEQDVRLISVIKTKRISTDSIENVEVIAGRAGLGPYRREFLELTLSTGQQIVFRELNSAISNGTSMVYGARDAINGSLLRPRR